MYDDDDDVDDRNDDNNTCKHTNTIKTEHIGSFFHAREHYDSTIVLALQS